MGLGSWITPTVGCLLILVSAAGHAVSVFSDTSTPGFVVENVDAGKNGAQLKLTETAGNSPISFSDRLLDSAGQNSVHAATLANLPNGNVGAWWFGGSREGGKDVRIWFAEYDQQSKVFSPARSILSRHQLAVQLDRYIKKLGNPAAVLDGNGRVWLFFVSVSIGGWAGSAVNYVTSDDGGKTWSSARRLVTSPFFNVSTLVRTPPVLLQDGSLAVPVYHEFIGKFAEILIVGPDGTVRNKKRLTWGRDALQPVLVPTSQDSAVVLMRYAGEPPMRMLHSLTDDRGRNFTRVRKLSLPNADNSVVASMLPDGGGIWIVYNSSEFNREALSIAVADSNVSEVIRAYDLESTKGGEFSYPAIITDVHGQHHVAWTHNRKNIKHVVFNDAWMLKTLQTEPVVP